MTVATVEPDRRRPPLRKIQPKREPAPDLESYFKIGISEDYILIRDDFPMNKVAPGDFARLCMEMFQRNEEALKNGK